MRQMFNNLSFLESISSLCFSHFSYIDGFHYAQKLIRYSFDQVCFAKGTFSQQLDLPVMGEFILLLQLLHIYSVLDYKFKIKLYTANL